MADISWGMHPLPEEVPIEWTLGPLNLLLRKQADELWVAYHYADTEPENIGSEADEQSIKLAWERWTLPSTVKSFSFTPIMPNLPIVFKPENPFHLAPGVKTRVYARVPLWVGIDIGATTVTEIPTLVLSKTWFGNFVDGELCFWVQSAARKSLNFRDGEDYLVVCPLDISNRSEVTLTVDKICHRIQRLSIFRAANSLYANEARVKYQGNTAGSEIEIAKKPPAEAAEAVLIGEAREELRKGFTARTFGTLFDLTGLGSY